MNKVNLPKSSIQPKAIGIDRDFTAHSIPAKFYDEFVIQLNENGFSLVGGRNQRYGIEHVRGGNLGYLYRTDDLSGDFLVQVRKRKDGEYSSSLEMFIGRIMPPATR